MLSRYAAASSFTTIWADSKQDKKGIERNIENEARYAKALYIWTDCDREGEHIGSEIRGVALRANARLEVKRAKFSNIERAYDPAMSISLRRADVDQPCNSSS